MKKVIIQHEQRTHAGSETGMGIAIAPNGIGVTEYQAVGRYNLDALLVTGVERAVPLGQLSPLP
jgi:hypothetical protein